MYRQILQDHTAGVGYVRSRGNLALLFATISLLIVMLPICARAQSLKPVPINRRITKKLIATDSVEGCHAFVDSVHTYLLGTVRHAVTAFDALPGHRSMDDFHTHFPKGEKVIISNQIGNHVCITNSAGVFLNRSGFVPRKDIKLTDITAVPKRVDWNGLWADLYGDWFEMYDLTTVAGKACASHCRRTGSFGNPLGTLKGYPVKNRGGKVLARTKFFSLPQYYNRCAKQHITSKCDSWGGTWMDYDTVTNSCRFYATLLPDGHRMIISAEDGICGDARDNAWTGLYYKIAAFPPVAPSMKLIKKYLEAHHFPLAHFDKQMRELCFCGSHDPTYCSVVPQPIKKAKH